MNSDRFIDYYKLLGLDVTASRETIQKKCLELGERYGPNDGSAGVLRDAENFARVEQAYTVLCDPKLREAYDRTYNDHYIHSLKPTTRDSSEEELWAPHERDGILIASIVIAVSVIATFMADAPFFGSRLGWFDQIRLSKIQLLLYEKSTFGMLDRYDYLIIVDLTTVLIVCFLLLMYGILVYIDILPRPVTIWKKLREQFGQKYS